MDSDEKYLDKLRYITFAGESTNMDDIRFIRRYYPDIKVFVMYGQTEASARLSYLDPELLESKPGSVGRGLSNVRLRVVDEACCDIKPGELGEIIASGPSIMRGYWEDPEATEEVLKDGWLHTGDHASVDEDGYIYIKGRKTDIIKHMGHRLSPVEIENVINSCGYIKESAAVESIQDGNSVIKAFIVLEKECPLDEIKRFVCSKLPFYMRPQIFELIGELPRTESGKIRRSALRRS
jgi:acyl-coenzyme A synthetase/AMP-(fatty) acid ligase